MAVRGDKSTMTRRHLLHPQEVPQVKAALLQWLRDKVDSRQDLPATELGFHCLYRLKEHRVGRPDYPEPVTWGLIENWQMVPFQVWGGRGKIPGPETRREPR